MSLKVVEPARPGGGSFLVVNLPQVKSHPAVKTFLRLADSPFLCPLTRLTLPGAHMRPDIAGRFEERLGRRFLSG